MGKLNQILFARVATGMAKSFGLRVTKAKLARAVPIAGAVIAGGFNGTSPGCAKQRP